MKGRFKRQLDKKGTKCFTVFIILGVYTGCFILPSSLRNFSECSQTGNRQRKKFTFFRYVLQRVTEKTQLFTFVGIFFTLIRQAVFIELRLNRFRSSWSSFFSPFSRLFCVVRREFVHRLEFYSSQYLAHYP